MGVARLNKDPELSINASQKGLPKSLERVLGKALKALNEVFPVSGAHLSVNPAIEIKNIAVEQDAELPSWKYVVVSLKLASWETTPMMHKDSKRRLLKGYTRHLHPRKLQRYCWNSDMFNPLDFLKVADQLKGGDEAYRRTSGSRSYYG